MVSSDLPLGYASLPAKSSELNAQLHLALHIRIAPSLPRGIKIELGTGNHAAKVAAIIWRQPASSHSLQRVANIYYLKGLLSWLAEPCVSIFV